LGQSRRSSLSGCQQCLSVSSSVLLSLFVSPLITVVIVGVGVPLMLTYVYGTVVVSLCRSRWGCGSSRTAADLGVVELENLAKRESHAAAQPCPEPSLLQVSPLEQGAQHHLPPTVNELWSVLPSPRLGEDGALDPTTPLPSSSRSPRPRPAWHSQSASTVALAGSMSEGQDTPDREGVTIEVEVSVEAVPRPAWQQSLSSALSGQSLSGDSLGTTSDMGSSMAVPVE
ncbi:RN19B ligase, partial [Neodrepanis coruscans]|nr:RN19B ligase [Neodrepanis coruscans]